VTLQLQFYSEVKKSDLPLKHAIPYIVASGVVYHENGVHKVVEWDGKNEPVRKFQKHRKQSNSSGNFHKARWNQAATNPSYLNPCEYDHPEHDEENSLCYPYIVTSRYDDKDFSYM
jgi:hypothetical protein